MMILFDSRRYDTGMILIFCSNSYFMYFPLINKENDGKFIIMQYFDGLINELILFQDSNNEDLNKKIGVISCYATF